MTPDNPTTANRCSVLVMNLGGPSSLDEVYPFLRSLFSDPAILRMPWFVRAPLARFIARSRAPTARKIYATLGGKSPILAETRAQAQKLEASLQALLGAQGLEVRAFVAMRHAAPLTKTAVREALAHASDIVMVPLYPQFATVTTMSSVKAFAAAVRRLGKTRKIRVACTCDWPDDADFAQAYATSARAALAQARADKRAPARFLFSAHGLPESIAKRDPYPRRALLTAQTIAARLGLTQEEWQLCWQSRVGPVAWLRPSTEEAIEDAAKAGLGVVVVPISFVSEHSETLVELDVEARDFALAKGAAFYARAPTPSADTGFIEALARRVVQARGKPAECWRKPGGVCPRLLAQA